MYGVTVVQKKLKQFTQNSAQNSYKLRKSTNLNAMYGEFGRVLYFTISL